jgi:hypothetical protein
MTHSQLKDLIKSFLKSSKYKNGRGYYFAIGHDGLVEENHYWSRAGGAWDLRADLEAICDRIARQSDPKGAGPKGAGQLIAGRENLQRSDSFPSGE